MKHISRLSIFSLARPPHFHGFISGQLLAALLVLMVLRQLQMSTPTTGSMEVLHSDVVWILLM